MSPGAADFAIDNATETKAETKALFRQIPFKQYWLLCAQTLYLWIGVTTTAGSTSGYLLHRKKI